MEFSVRERLILTNGFFPERANVTDLRIIADAQRDLGFTEEDIAEFHQANSDGGVSWDVTRERPKEVSIGPRLGAIIRERLQAMDKGNQLTADHLPLWERFVEADLEIRAVS